MLLGRLLLIWLLSPNFFGYLGCGAPTLAMDEVEELRLIAEALNRPPWNFSVDPCIGDSSWVTAKPNSVWNTTVRCSCTDSCHVTDLVASNWNLSGMLPQLTGLLPNLRLIDLSYNYLNGTIPAQWGSMQLSEIDVGVNRLSGRIPKELGNISTLTSLIMDSNRLSGNLPPELGNLTNLEKFAISSNNFTGKLPAEFAKLSNMKEFRISDNRFTGNIPDFIQKWTNLEKLEIQGTDMEGPIPLGISDLVHITKLLISDISGPESPFPNLSTMPSIKLLSLRNCNLVGDIPSYIGGMKQLKLLDLSFNKLTGRIPHFAGLQHLATVYLTSNLLTGPTEEWMFQESAEVDFSYNNLTIGSPSPQSCQQGNVNLFGSSSMGARKNGVLPCSEKIFRCSNHHYSLHINCGGDQTTVNKSTIYEADKLVHGTSIFVSNDGWAISSTGNFVNNDSPTDTYVAYNQSTLLMPNSELYATARISPLSLTYYGFCLLNGNYTLKLHFAEIILTDDRTYSSLGRRIFDIYIQGKLALQDFNIINEAGGSGREVVKKFFSVPVVDQTLEVRLIWAGRGSQRVPVKGTYGPLISAISVDPEFPPPKSSKDISVGAIVGIAASILFVAFWSLFFLWRKGWLGVKKTNDQDFRDLGLQTTTFTLRQIRAATNNFDISNKIGEGGFGSVYKGQLSDGTLIAVKQLSSKSNQGNREFLNEIGMISALQHPNLVKLYGCCIEGDQLLLVYEYMENNSLARAVFGREEHRLQLNWTVRHKICVGIARGLAYLHEESRLKVVHRDIKTTNVLLDRDLSPKISDFGIARLGDAENTHISTGVAGTIGYMAPEYAMHGYLTEKADVYSFGVVALEIVSGKNVTNFRPEANHIHLVNWAYMLRERGNPLDLVDPSLGSKFNKEEAIGVINVALSCTNASPVLRPTMSVVVGMLEGKIVIQEPLPNARFPEANGGSNEEAETKISTHGLSSDLTSSIVSQNKQIIETSASGSDLYPLIFDTQDLETE